MDEVFIHFADDAQAGEIVNHVMSSNVDGHIWVEHGVQDMMTKVLNPDFDNISDCSEDDTADDDYDGGIMFDDSEEERGCEVEEEQFEEVQVELPISGNRVEVNGKSMKYKVMGSKDPKKMNIAYKGSKVNVLVPKSVLGSSSQRNETNFGSRNVDYDIEKLDSSDPDESDKDDKQPKSKYEKFRGELLNKDFQFKLGMGLFGNT